MAFLPARLEWKTVIVAHTLITEDNTHIEMTTVLTSTSSDNNTHELERTLGRAHTFAAGDLDL